MSRYGMRSVSSHCTVSLTASAWAQLTYSRWVITRIHTPASDRRHNASAAPSMAGRFASIRCSMTAVA